jgi:hypothetical protein
MHTKRLDAADLTGKRWSATMAARMLAAWRASGRSLSDFRDSRAACACATCPPCSRPHGRPCVRPPPPWPIRPRSPSTERNLRARSGPPPTAPERTDTRTGTAFRLDQSAETAVWTSFPGSARRLTDRAARQSASAAGVARNPPKRVPGVGYAGRDGPLLAKVSAAQEAPQIREASIWRRHSWMDAESLQRQARRAGREAFGPFFAALNVRYEANSDECDATGSVRLYARRPVYSLGVSRSSS